MWYTRTCNALNILKDIPPLFFRLILAYGFYGPAMSKFHNIEGTTQFFANIGIPFPELSAYVVAIIEAAGVVLLILGFFTRIISLLLIIVMIVAIFTVHVSHGFSCSNHGFEIPLYYTLMLFSLFIRGAGVVSIDAAFKAIF
ncbi:DoxX family protein, partial [Simkania negevensis]|nr:DoxX family protein [Simkania negevensis]